MNIKALIKKYEAVECVVGIVSRKTILKTVLRDLKQLDEPQPVKVPQFVADWYEKKKHDLNHYIWDYIYNWNHQEESEFKRWMNCSIISFQTLVNMHQFGYEVEKEKRYTVVMKETKQPLYYNAGDKKLFFSLGGIATNFTRKQLEDADFGWVFDCEGIEIEEVE